MMLGAKHGLLACALVVLLQLQAALAAASDGRPFLMVSDSNVELHVPAAKDAVVVSYDVDATIISEQSNRATQAVSSLNSLNQLVQNLVGQVTSYAAQTVANSQATLSGSAVSKIALVTPQLDSVESLVTSTNILLANAASTTIVQGTNLATAINNERLTLPPWQANMGAKAATLQTTVTLATADETAEYVTLWMAERSYVATLSASVSSAVAGFTASESTRSATAFAALQTAASSAAVVAMTDYPTQVTSTIDRNIAAQPSVMASVAFTAIPIASTTTNDLAACSTEGGTYYSSTNKLSYFCNAAFNSPMPSIFNGFASSTILNTIQSYALITELKSHKWTLCFSGVTHGFSASTFHTNCNNKGPTVTIALANTGRIGGGFMDVSFKNSQNYIPSNRAFLYTFNSNTLTRTVQFYPQYAIYDYSTYGPTFGGGHDFYIQNSANIGSMGSHSYVGNNYSPTWMFATSSPSFSKLEVWYAS